MKDWGSSVSLFWRSGRVRDTENGRRRGVQDGDG